MINDSIKINLIPEGIGDAKQFVIPRADAERIKEMLSDNEKVTSMNSAIDALNEIDTVVLTYPYPEPDDIEIHVSTKLSTTEPNIKLMDSIEKAKNKSINIAVGGIGVSVIGDYCCDEDGDIIGRRV